MWPGEGALVRGRHPSRYLPPRGSRPPAPRDLTAGYSWSSGACSGRTENAALERNAVRMGPAGQMRGGVRPSEKLRQFFVNLGFDAAFEHPHQEIVDALAGSRLVDRKAVDSILA